MSSYLASLTGKRFSEELNKQIIDARKSELNRQHVILDPLEYSKELRPNHYK